MKRTWSKRARAGSLLMAFLMGFTALNLIPAGRGGAAQPVSAAEVPALKTVYVFPAKDWESEALPLGNGFPRRHGVRGRWERPRTHTIRVVLNPENTAAETNTANNRHSALVRVADI